MVNSSKKEVFLAIFIGLAAGFIFSYLSFFNINRSKSNKLTAEKSPTEKVKINLSPSPKEENKEKITHLKITTPENYSLVKESTVNIKGKAPLNSQILIFGEKEEKVLTIKENQNFSIEINLNEGPNEIIFSLIKDGQEIESETINIIYEAPSS